MSHSLPVTGNTSKIEHGGHDFYPALTGLRGVAVLAVFLCHYADPLGLLLFRGWHHSPFWFGWAGVDVFFVLSGFLITGILFDSLHKERYFRNFYIRRTLRIFPLFYAIWAICLLLTPFVHVGWNRYVIAQMFYVGNLALLGAIRGLHPDPGILMIGKYPIVFGHYWTLCIEEQFYLVWPVIVYLVRRREVLLRLSISVAGLILIARCLVVVIFYRHPSVFGALYNSSFSRFDSLLIGAALVLWLRGRPSGFKASSASIYAWLFFAPSILLALLLVTIGRLQRPLETNNFVFVSVGFTLLALSSTGAILAALDPRTRVHRWLQYRWLVSLGTVSYGFYIFHAIPLRILENANLLGPNTGTATRFLVPIVAFIFFYLLSKCSYFFYERRFLKLKDRFAPQNRVRILPESRSVQRANAST